MKNLRSKIVGRVVFVASLWLLTWVPVQAAPITVNCPTDSLQTAVEAALPGDVINVTGTCNENVLIRNEKQRFTLDGHNVATVHGPSSSTATLNVRGKGILIQNFEITGGYQGVWVNRGSNAQVNHNNIHNTGAYGIVINQLAFSVIKSNNIHDNPADGIVVSENSVARIGFDTTGDSSPSLNTIQNNGGRGIWVTETSFAYIVGNTIANNGSDGIGVFRNSQANIDYNTINNNGFSTTPAGNGINVSQNGGIQLAEDGYTPAQPSPVPPDFFKQPNITSGNNVGYGVACSLGAYVRGHWGDTNAPINWPQIMGALGRDSINSTCPQSVVTP